MSKQVTSVSNNKYIIIPCFDQEISKFVVTKIFILEDKINLIKDEEYFVSESDEENFNIFNGSGEFVGSGKYHENTELEGEI